MCGIYGVVGETTIFDVINNLKKLEYRGYDSSGIAYFKNSNIIIEKETGEIKNLQQKLINRNEDISCAISHTRWATHGKVTVENSHPHTSENKKFVLVHNGIIENYKELIISNLKDIKISSQTDSEIIVQLIEKNYQGNMLYALSKTCSMLVGSYALAVMFECNKDVIYVAKNNSPAYILTGKLGNRVCSDFAEIRENDDKIYSLENGEFAVITQHEILFYDNKLGEIGKEALSVTNNKTAEGLKNYPHYMLKEINDIPKSIIKTVGQYDSVLKLCQGISRARCKKLKRIIIIACGTAYNAGLMGKQIIESSTNIHVDVEIASEFRYSNMLVPKGTLAIFVSQSGETADTITCVKLMKEQGIKTLSITNVENSSITFVSDVCLYTSAGSEIAVASTKAYVSQVVMFYMLATYFKIIQYEKENEEEYYKREIYKIINVAKIINKTNFHELIKPIAKKYENMQKIFVIGRLQDYKTSVEASLKVKEITYMHCEAYPAGELKHGTMSQVNENTLVVAFITNDEISKKTFNAVAEVKSRGANVLVITDDEKVKCENVDDVVLLPKISQKYLPILSIIPMQCFAYEVSILKGYNPDKPKNLAKSVTVE